MFPTRFWTVTATIAGPVVYVNEGHTVRALDRFTGRAVWEQTAMDLPRASVIRDRDNAPAGDLNVVAVDGDTLVTLTGHAYADARSGGGKVVCLDASTGRRRWSKSLGRLGNEKEYENLFPHGAPILAEGSVYLLARKVSAQMLTGCYVVALDVETGALRWIRHVASSGSKTKAPRRFDTLAHRDDRLYVATAVGAVACLDAHSGSIRWLRRYEVPVNVRGRSYLPWQMGGAVTAPHQVLAITPDHLRIVALDAETGDELESHDARARDGWNTPSYLLASDRMVYAVGSEIRAFAIDMLDRPLWRLPAREESLADRPTVPSRSGRDRGAGPGSNMSLVGRVQLVEGALIVPTMGGMLFVDGETGHVLHRLATKASGNPIAVGAQLVVAGADSLDAYMSLARAEQMLRERIARAGDDADPALSLVQLGMRVGNIELALEGADLALAIVNRTPNQASPTDARRELFNMLLEVHDRGIATTDEAREGLYGMIGAVAATAEQRVEYLLAYGDGLRKQAPARAVEKYQAILSDIVLAGTVRSEAGLLQPASHWAAARLARLIRTHGARIYAPQEDYARRALLHLRETRPDDEAAFAELAMEFPLAEAGLEAAVLAASVHRDREQTREALTMLAKAYRLSPEPARADQLLGPFVAICVEADLVPAGRAILATFAEDRSLATRRGPREAGVWRRDLETTTPRPVRARPWPQGTEGPTAETITWRLLPPGDEARADAALLARGSEIRRVQARDLTTAWTTTLDAEPARLLSFGADRALLWLDENPEDPRVVAIAARDGKVQWTTPPLADHLPPPLLPAGGVNAQLPDGMPFVPQVVLPRLGDEAVYLIRRTGGVAAFDRASGALLWTQERTLEQVHHALIHPFGVVLAGMDRVVDPATEPEPRVLVLDPRTGRRIHRLAPRSRAGVLWVAADPVGLLVCATPDGLEAIDLLTGQRPWTNIAFDATDARRGWMTAGHLILDSRTGVLFSARLEDGVLSDPFDGVVRGDWDRDALKDVHILGDRIFARYRDRIIRYDPEGNVRGADIISDNRDYRWLLGNADRLALVSQFDNRQVQGEGEARRQQQRVYRVYVLSDTGKLEGEVIELPPLNRRLEHAAIIDGWLLLSTNRETVVVPMGERAATEM